MNSTTTPQLTPEAFKEGTLKAHPDWVNAVASDGTKYSEMDPIDFTRRFAQKYPDAVTSTGHKYADYLPPAPAEPINTASGADQGLIGKLGNRISNIVQTTKDVYSGKTEAPLGGLHTVGELGGAITDTAGAALGLANKVARVIPGVAPVEDAAMDVLKSGVQGAVQSPTGQKIVQGYQNFAQNNPKTATAIGDIGNIVGAASLFTGAGAAKEAAVNAFGKDVVTSVAEDIAPTLTNKVASKAILKGGTTKSLLTRTIAPALDPALEDSAGTILQNVPGFSKLKTFSDKVNAVQDAVSNMATSLKNDVIQSGADRIYSYKELGSVLRNIPKPTLLVGDMEKVYGKVIDKALEIAKENGGKISNLFDARKGFDSFIAREFPNLYSSDALTPMRVAVKNIRNGINSFIEQNLPDGLGFRERLLDQSTLLKAAENMAPKAVKEIGTSGLGRFAARHPLTAGFLKTAAKNALTGAEIVGGGGLVGGAGYGLYQKIFGQH